MAYVEFNPNPTGRRVGDCAVRAIAAALDISWEEAFALLAVNAYQMGDVISADSVWGSVLRQHGFYPTVTPAPVIELQNANLVINRIA